jgi:hypothetical protein
MPIQFPALFTENNEKYVVPHKKFSTHRSSKVTISCSFQLHPLMAALLGGKEDGLIPLFKVKEDQLYWRNKWIRKQLPSFITI